jgi:hypothetical protein
MTLTGGLLLAAFLYRMGGELLTCTSPERTRLRTVIRVIVWPVVLGTALVVFAFLPMPPPFIQDWIASSSNEIRAGGQESLLNTRNDPQASAITDMRRLLWG